ncbi:hypothetical protein [Marinobacterium aestuariivivens]|uniref:Hydantoinase B/oxoprolinase domain-containing protein n=1 Tax=Marinobacterium aestuariivivens TaxID=1698799 RepID=A0ABW2A442_9GAMM
MSISPGERVTNINPGGGGYGDPFGRDVEAVLADFRNGLVSLEGAEREYGVAIRPQDGSLDVERTANLRQQPLNV